MSLPRALRALLAAALLLPASACLLIPTPEHGLLEGRGAITAEDTAFLAPGATSREAVLLRFGEPDAVLDGEAVLAYEWAVARGYIFVGAYYTGTAAPIRKHYLLLLSFDDSGLLKRWEMRECVLRNPVTLLEEWARQDRPAPSAPSLP